MARAGWRGPTAAGTLGQMEHDTIAAPDTASTNVGSAEGLATAPAVTLVDDELLVEEISIDGMCGVY